MTINPTQMEKIDKLIIEFKHSHLNTAVMKKYEKY